MLGSEKRAKVDGGVLRPECHQYARSPAGQGSAMLIYLSAVALGAQLSAELDPFEEGNTIKTETLKNSSASCDGGVHLWEPCPFWAQR